MVKEFAVIQISKKKNLIRKVIILAIFLPFIYIFIFFKTIEENEIHSKILGIYMTVWVLSMMLSNFLISSYNKINKLIFYNDSVMLFSKKYELKEIYEIRINIRDYYGERSNNFDITNNRGHAPEEGINNYIIFKFINNDRERHRFLINSKTELNVIKKILEFYKSKGVNVSLTIKGNEII